MHPTGVDVACPDLFADVIRLVSKYQDYAQAYPPDEIGPRTACHQSCNHRNYNLTCSQFEQLHVAAGHTCQRCRTAGTPLYIDHDHTLGMWAVRGLLCPWCNSHLGQVDTGRKPMDELTFQYLLNPYPYRRPFPIRPRWALSTIAARAYRRELNRASIAAGHGPVVMGHQGRGWNVWRAQWERNPKIALLIHLVRGAYDAISPEATTATAFGATEAAVLLTHAQERP